MSDPSPEYGITEADIDLGPWIGASPEESGSGAEFRREVAAVAREVLVDLARRGVDIGRARRKRNGAEAGGGQVEGGVAEGPDESAEGARGAGEEVARGRGSAGPMDPLPWEPRDNTPFLLVRAGARLEARLEVGRRRGPEHVQSHRRDSRGFGVRRDLALLEAARPGGTSPAGLRRRLGLASASVSGLVGRCESRGLVERRPLGSDRRTSRITLTASGLEAAACVVRSWQAADDALLSGLSMAERNELRRLLHKAARALA